eukprot:GHVR01068347.1.p1 GENE.GHVR01068347.1~~GHVR01068347.1.p1  ORF type:complete len:585 (-),score=119.13 GHVR01068347.1:84-1838(-)
MGEDKFDPDDMKNKLEKVLANRDNFEKSAAASFKQFDVDNSGALDFTETRKLVVRLFENMRIPPIDEETMFRIFHRYDFGGDGVLLFEEFTDMYYNLLCRIRDRYYPPKLLRIKQKNFVRRTTLKHDKVKIEDLFIFKKKLGSGSFGEVHLVEEKTSQVERVCKTISKDKSAVPIEQIEAEIRIMKELDHPGVVKIFEVYDDRHNMYMIMEYLSGGELLHRLSQAHDRNEKLSEAYAASVMHQVFGSLAYIHKKKIIHKDLKPENLMFVDTSEGAQMKLIDFGLSEMFSDSSETSRKAAGTALYMSPEVYSRKFNFKCDVWSAGVILYILLTSRLPYMGKSVEEVKQKVLHEKMPLERDCRAAGVSECGMDILKMILVKDMKNRPTAEQCLSHPWFNSSLDQKSSMITTEMGESLKVYMKQSALKNAFLNLLTNTLSLNNNKILGLQAAFKCADKDCNGTLCTVELSEALKQVDVPVWDITRICQAMDVDDDKTISYSEFVAALYAWQDTELNQLWSAFKKMDLDGDGLITVDEFLTVLIGEGATQKLISREDAPRITREIDQNGNGLIEWDEFVDFMKNNTIK